MAKQTGLLDHIFNAESIAVIGASSQPGRVGTYIIRSLLRRYQGKLIFVSRREERIFSQKALSSIDELPTNIPLAILAVDEQLIPSILTQLNQRHVKAVIIFSQTYKPMDLKISEVLKDINITLLGSHSCGVFDNISGIDTLLIPQEIVQRPPKGKLGIVVSNQMTGYKLLDLAAYKDIGVSRFIDVGHQIGVKAAESIKYLVNDPHTKTILLCLDCISDDEAFIKVGLYAKQQNKPLIIHYHQTEALKLLPCQYAEVNRFHPITDDLIERSAMITTKSFDEAFTFVHGFSSRILPKANEVTILANGIDAARASINAAVINNIKIPPITEKTSNEIEKTQPDGCHTQNPICIRATLEERYYSSALRMVLNDADVKNVLVTLYPNIGLENPTRVAIVTVRTVREFDKAVYFVLPPGDESRIFQQYLKELEIPVFTSPSNALKAMKVAIDYHQTQVSSKKPNK